ncbi:MAG: CBS domain-containing protein [Deltaproteobacteria bacterium]|nr:CBS domain-containing protein [Deltaproteobacteria bacterium]
MTALETVGQHMDTHVPTLSPTQPILEAIRFLVRHRVTGAPVVDSEGKLLGILSERDCLGIFTAEGGGLGTNATVSDFMTTEVVTVTPEMKIGYVAGLFLRHSFRRLIVLENEKVVGAITRFDILRYTAYCLPG